MPDFQIRIALPSEHAVIDELAIEAWHVLKPGYDLNAWGPLLEATGRMSGLARDGTLLVAASKDRVCGAVVYMPPGRSNPTIFPEGWPSIRMLVVHPDRRGQGLGRRLTQTCIDRARHDGATHIGLHTSVIMSVAEPMYVRMGFVRDAELPPIAGAPYGRYVLRL